MLQIMFKNPLCSIGCFLIAICVALKIVRDPKLLVTVLCLLWSVGGAVFGYFLGLNFLLIRSF